MSDKSMQHEEYQYPGDEYVVAPKTIDHQPEAVEEEVAPARKVPAWQRFLLLNKRKVFMLGVLVVGIVSFQLMHQKSEPVAVLPPVAQPVAAPVVNNDDQLMLQKSLAELQQNSDSNNQQIANLKGQLATVNDQLKAANEANQQLKQGMVLLLQELRNLNDEMAKKTVAKPAVAHSPEVVYAVRAMVDGRAWIQGSNGLSQSVTLGDPIPGYGNVTEIQTAQGAIMTSSGKEIRLGTNDY